MLSPKVSPATTNNVARISLDRQQDHFTFDYIYLAGLLSFSFIKQFAY
jgi:hypothetical protein